MATNRRARSSGLGVLGFGAAAVAVLCCAGLPLLTAALGGLTLAAVLGIGAGAVVVAAGAVFGLLFFSARRRRNCDTKEDA